MCCCICACWAHASRSLLLRLCSSLLQHGFFVQDIPSKVPQFLCRCAHKLRHMKAPSLCICTGLCMLPHQHACMLLLPMCVNILCTILRHPSHTLHFVLLTGYSWGYGTTHIRPWCRHAQSERLTQGHNE